MAVRKKVEKVDGATAFQPPVPPVMVPKPHWWYWAEVYGEPEIILMAANPQYFLLHADERAHNIAHARLIKAIGSREDAIARLAAKHGKTMSTTTP